MGSNDFIVLYLIPEVEIVLTELKVVEAILLHEGKSHAVEASEDPAAAGITLVGHRLAFLLQLKVTICKTRFKIRRVFLLL